MIDKENGILYIIMEYCSKGDLSGIVKTHQDSKKLIEESTIWRIFVYILLALNDCHNRKDKPILHRDLKPANIFISEGDCLKLGDFGLSKELGSNSKFASTNVGTPYYMSPEQVNEEKHNHKSDIWSLG
jgi:serine/threonine protein kinase